MKKIYLFLTTALLVLSACEKDQIDRYDLENYIYFTLKETDEQRFSFSYYPGSTTRTFEYEVNLMGRIMEQDTPFQLYVDEEKTTATADMYELNLTPVFHKGVVTDVVTLTVKNPDNVLNDKEVTLVFGIKENANFKPGFIGQQTITIHFNNIASKPLWWNDTVELYLGDYSADKFNAFVICTGVTDMTDMDESLMRQYALDFKKYCQDNGLDYDIPAY